MNMLSIVESPVNPINAFLPTVLPTSDVLGVPFNGLRLPEVIDVVHRFINEKIPRQICLANAYTVSLSWKDEELRHVLQSADVILPDGMSIVWGGRWVGASPPCRIAGPDLSQALCQDAENEGYRIFFLGSTPATLAQLKQVLLSRWPKLQIVGMFSPPICEKLNDAENAAIFSQLRKTKPDILFVGMSTPKQEKWIAANLKNLEVPVSIGIGAAFDFLSGRIPRAPEGLQKAGLEWLYRLWCEPRRLWRRYLLGNAIFIAHLLWAWMRHTRLSARSMKG